jgi:carbonic anhydrase
LKNPGINWWEPEKAIAFTFLPSYTPAVPKLEVVNFTHVATGDFGSIFITEPSDYAATQVIKWQAKDVRFHYPSEHTIAGVSYDLEMQIHHVVSNLTF